MTSLELSAVDKVSLINQKEFSDLYFKPLHPLVIKDLAKSWPASKKYKGATMPKSVVKGIQA